MYNIKRGYSCGIKATLLTPAGTLCDLRKSRYIAAVLVLPSGATMPCVDLSFDEVSNAIYVRLLPTRELTAVGTYGIVFNVKLGDNTMYSTKIVNFAEVSTTADVGYHELTIALSIGVVDFPDNVAYTGASPKISANNTWLVYDDSQNAYVDTGIEVGYANLISRYDSKYADIVVPCQQATDAANAAKTAANTAAASATAAAGNATTAANNANSGATAANNAATLANNKAADANNAATAANNGATAANQAAEAAEVVVTTYDDVINALAHSDCSLEQRIGTLERLLAAVFSGDVVLPALKVRDLSAQNTDIVSVGVGAPSIIPDRAGQFYINTVAKTLYHSTGNSAISDWNLA